MPSLGSNPPPAALRRVSRALPHLPLVRRSIEWHRQRPPRPPSHQERNRTALPVPRPPHVRQRLRNPLAVVRVRRTPAVPVPVAGRADRGSPFERKRSGHRFGFPGHRIDLASARDVDSIRPFRALVGITLQQFEQLKNRVGGTRRVPTTVLDPAVTSKAKPHCVILGVDPSLRGTGYGIIRLTRPQPELLAQGTIKSPARWERSRCLLHIAQSLREVFKHHQPTVCVVEGLFYAQNLQTALIMGEARGASLVAVAEAGMEIFEIAPRKVKQAVVGYGAAQKSAVAKMVQRLLRLSDVPAPDAADALALALTYAQENSRYNLAPPKRI